MAQSTSFRISDTAKHRLVARAELEGISATALIDRLIVEGVDQLEHPGIVFRGPGHDRRAALAGGPDVWEVVSRLQELSGEQEERIAVLSAESELHPRLIRMAIEYAVENADEIQQRIDRNRQAAERSLKAAEQRAALIA